MICPMLEACRIGYHQYLSQRTPARRLHFSEDSLHPKGEDVHQDIVAAKIG